MTVEDPIEFLHSHKKCIVNQRELGSDAQSFALALKAALRQDPDVILVGEMRDLETISTALTAAETGHLVFATLHTQTAPSDDRPHHRRLPGLPAGPGAHPALRRAAGGHDPAAAAHRRRLVARRGLRGARADAGRAQPHPRGQDPPDPVRRCRPARASACRRWTPRWPALVRSGQDHPAPRRGALVHSPRSCAACSAPATSAWPRSDGRLRLQGDGPRRREGDGRGRGREQAGRSPTSSRRAA